MAASKWTMRKMAARDKRAVSRAGARINCSHIGHDHVQMPRESHASIGNERRAEPWALLRAHPALAFATPTAPTPTWQMHVRI